MQQRKPLPSQETLQRFFRYEPHTGFLYWRPRTLDMFEGRMDDAGCFLWNMANQYKRVRLVRSGGYGAVHVLGNVYKAHRVIWKLTHNEEPEAIDHKNGDTTDNRIANLRAANAKINARNTARSAANTSGIVGVRWDDRSNKWIATIGYEGKSFLIGAFKSKSKAIAARKKAEKICGFHKNHGRETPKPQNKLGARKSLVRRRKTKVYRADGTFLWEKNEQRIAQR